MSNIEKLPVVLEMAESYKLTGPSLVHTFKQIAAEGKIKDTELLGCLMVAKEHKLNPLTKEIYFMKTKSGQIQPIVSVDGWIKKCNSHPEFDGMEFSDTVDDKGKLVSITCKIYRKDRGRPTVVTEYMEECKGNTGPWKSHPSRMLRHRALIQCARIAFGFSGVMDPDEFKTWQDTVDVTPAAEAPNFDEIEAEMEAEPEVEDVEGKTIDLEEYLADHGGVLEVGGRMVTFDDAVSDFEQEIAICADLESLNEVLEQWDHVIQRLPRKQSGEVERLFEDAKTRIEQGEEAA